MINVLIADDHAIVRQGLKQIVSETTDIQLAGEATNGTQTLQQVRAGRCDVLVLVINLPDYSGFEIIKILQNERPNMPILILSIHAEDQFAVRPLKAGAAGYLTKECAPKDLLNAIRQVANGKKYISQQMTHRLCP